MPTIYEIMENEIRDAIASYGCAVMNATKYEGCNKRMNRAERSAAKRVLKLIFRNGRKPTEEEIDALCIG
jgi:hypothetical protein